MRSKAAIVSFFLVFALYLVYGWALVPLVLPNPVSNNGRTMNASVHSDTTREEIEPFLELFPQDGWERNPEAEIHFLRFGQTGQTIILFEKDEIAGKVLRLKPCTVLLLPEGKEFRPDEEIESQIQQAVVLRTPLYAEIEFDKDFDISKMTHPKIVKGNLYGEVTIQSNVQDSGRQNNFSLKTKTVEITESPGLTRIETLEDVQFTFGAHSGAGSGLTLDIVQSDLTQPQSEKTLSSVRFQRLKSLRFVLPEDSKAPVNLTGQPAATLDILCQGEFFFAANPADQDWTASFYRNVNITRNNSDNTVDRLTAEEVQLTLKPIEEETAGKKSSFFDRIEPVLFVARSKPGQNSQKPVPARLSIKKDNDITLVGDEIRIDLRNNFILLSTRETPGASPFAEMLVADQYKILSERWVKYTLGQDGGFGKLDSDGKGSLTGKTGEGTAAKDFLLEWNEMQMEPHPLVKDQILLKLDKGISAQMTGFGTMKADALELCFNFVPSNQSAQSAAKLSGTGNQKNNLILDQAVVKNNVLFETASGTCNVKQLHIFFTNILAGGQARHSRWMPPLFAANPPIPPGQSVGQSALMIQQPIQQVQYLEPLKPQGGFSAPIQPLYTPPAASVIAPAYANRSPIMQPSSAARPKNALETQNLLGIKSSSGSGKFEMTADLMRMQIVVQDGQSSADRIAFEGNVRLKEIAVNDAPNTAIEMIGDTVMIWNPSDPATQIQITGHAAGNTAIFKGRGVELYARELNLSRKDNMFWSPGAGQLIAYTGQIQMPEMNFAKPSHSANLDDKLTVEWNKEMYCDGRVLHFYGQPGKTGNRVKTTYETKTLWCDSMQIELNRQVIFFEDQSVKPEAVNIWCLDNVHILNIEYDEQGKQKSVDRGKMSKLHYDVPNRYFIAEGPGELNSMSLGSRKGFEKAQLAGTSNNLRNSEGLNYLAVWFQDTMQGLLLDTKKLEIRGMVEAVYYPAASWEDTISRENFGAARKTGYTMECKRLQIEEVPNPLDLAQNFMELKASDDALIDGGGFFGKAQTIRYNQARSIVYLDGNVKFQTTVQGKSVSNTMQSIQYNIETGNVITQIQGLSIGQ